MCAKLRDVSHEINAPMACAYWITTTYVYGSFDFEMIVSNTAQLATEGRSSPWWDPQTKNLCYEAK